MPRLQTVAPLALALWLVPAIASAQDGPFEPGYLVVESDTVRGEIAVGFEAAASRGARFRATPDGPASDVTPDDARAFGTDAGRTYRRGRFATGPDTGALTVLPPLAFARVALDGPAALLAYEAVEGRPTFFLDLDGEQTGLFLVETDVETGRGLRRSVQAQYRQALLVRLGDCAPGGLATLAYTERALVGAVAAYNACVDPGYQAATQTVDRRRSTARPVVGLGYLVGDFARGPGRDPGVEDPAPGAFHVTVGARVAPWFAPDAARVTVALRYEHDLLRVPRRFNPVRESQVNVLALDLGGRVVVPAGGARVELGGGLLAGQTIEWQTADDIEPTEREGLFRLVREGDLRWATGQYAELAVGAGPTEVAVRAQGLAFANAPNLLPLISTAPYAVRSLSVSVARTF